MLIQKFLRSTMPKQPDLHVLLCFAVVVLLGLILPTFQIKTAQGDDENTETVKSIDRDELLEIMKASKYDVESDNEKSNAIIWKHAPLAPTRLEVEKGVISHYWIIPNAFSKKITLEFINKWNASERFSMLWMGGDVVVMQSDLYSGVGVTVRQVSAFLLLCESSRKKCTNQLVGLLQQ